MGTPNLEKNELHMDDVKSLVSKAYLFMAMEQMMAQTKGGKPNEKDVEEAITRTSTLIAKDLERKGFTILKGAVQ